MIMFHTLISILPHIYNWRAVNFPIFWSHLELFLFHQLLKQIVSCVEETLGRALTSVRRNICFQFFFFKYHGWLFEKSQNKLLETHLFPWCKQNRNHRQIIWVILVGLNCWMAYGMRDSGMAAGDRIQSLGFGSRSLGSLLFICRSSHRRCKVRVTIVVARNKNNMHDT